LPRLRSGSGSTSSYVWDCNVIELSFVVSPIFLRDRNGCRMRSVRLDEAVPCGVKYAHVCDLRHHGAVKGSEDLFQT
jgi:hypothetical protein